MSANGRAWMSRLLWVAVGLVFAQQLLGVVRGYGVPIAGNDFPAFYCAGSAVLAHADPYEVEPLRTCEHALPHGSDLPAQYVTPAPLPPYALDVFALLAELPYRIAAWTAYAVLLASAIALVLVLARVTQIPSGAIASAMLLSAGLASLLFGQIPIAVTLFVVLCGAALLRNDDASAAVWAGAATIEPHVGLPVAIALFVLRPATRPWLVGAAAICVAAGVLAVTPPVALHYFTVVLPAHARAELLTVDQFSVSHVLARFGVPENVSLIAGSLSYVLTLVLGVAAAKMASRRLDAAAIAYVPAATALLAGTFVHQIQLIAALPAAYLCIARGTRALAWTGRFVVATVAVAPFTIALSQRPVIDALALLCGVGALVAAVPRGERLDFTHALGGFVLAALCVAFPLAVQHAALPVYAAPAPVALPASSDASDNWGAYLRSDPRYATLRIDAEASKIPVWLGLSALLVATLGAGLMRRDQRAQIAWDARPRIQVTE